MANSTIQSVVEENGYPEMLSKSLDKITIMGASGVTTITVNGAVHQDFTVDFATSRVEIFNLGLNPTFPFKIEFLKT